MTDEIQGRLSPLLLLDDSVCSLGTCIYRSCGAGGRKPDPWRTGPGEDLVHREVGPALSKIQIFDTSGREVDRRDVKIDPSNAALLVFPFLS